MKLLFIVLMAAVFGTACNNSTVDAAAVKSVDSAAAAAPDTIKAVVVDTAVKAPVKRVGTDTAR
jgi:hypothetical protein